MSHTVIKVTGHGSSRFRIWLTVKLIMLASRICGGTWTVDYQ